MVDDRIINWNIQKNRITKETPTSIRMKHPHRFELEVEGSSVRTSSWRAVDVVDTCCGCHDNSMTLDRGVLFAISMTGYASLDEESEASCRGNNLKLPLCFLVSDPSGSLTYQLTGWNVSPACLVMTPSLP